MGYGSGRIVQHVCADKAWQGLVEELHKGKQENRESERPVPCSDGVRRAYSATAHCWAAARLEAVSIWIDWSEALVITT